MIIELGFSPDQSRQINHLGAGRVLAKDSGMGTVFANGKKGRHGSNRTPQCCRFSAGEGDAAEQAHKVAALKRARAD